MHSVTSRLRSFVSILCLLFVLKYYYNFVYDLIIIIYLIIIMIWAV